MTQPIVPGISLPPTPAPLTLATLRTQLPALMEPLREGFGARLSALRPGAPVAAERVPLLFDAHVLALGFTEQPERVARELATLVSQRFADDAGAQDVASAGEAFLWALRDTFADAFTPAVGASVREALAMLKSLTSRAVQHRTGEFAAVPRAP